MSVEEKKPEQGNMECEPYIIGGAVVNGHVRTYYTIIYSYDELGMQWWGTSILDPTIEGTMSVFQGYKGVKHFKVVKIEF